MHAVEKTQTTVSNIALNWAVVTGIGYGLVSRRTLYTVLFEIGIYLRSKLPGTADACSKEYTPLQLPTGAETGFKENHNPGKLRFCDVSSLQLRAIGYPAGGLQKHR